MKALDPSKGVQIAVDSVTGRVSWDLQRFLRDGESGSQSKGLETLRYLCLEQAREHNDLTKIIDECEQDNQRL